MRRGCATGTYDHDGELTSAVLAGTTTGYAYNADGEQLSAKQGSATVTSATWNGAGQLTSYDSPAADMTAATYDGDGVRASMTTASGTQNFTWGAAGDLLMDSSNAYIYTGSGAPAEQLSLATGTATYLNTDSLGSVRGVVTSAGALAASTSYDAWGNPQTTGGLTADTPFGYAGAYTDPDGLLYLINRYYNPATGQFLSVDPDVATTGEPYGYAGGNPVDNADPDGLMFAFETSSGAIIGSMQYLARVVPIYIRYNPPPPPRTPAKKRTPPKRRKAVRKAANNRKAKSTKPATCHAARYLPAGTCVPTSEFLTPSQGRAVSVDIGLTIVNALQGGADPVTDSLEAGSVAATAEDFDGSECSFSAGTKVLLASGAAVPIASLTPGDKVLATNTKTGKTQAEPATAVMVHHDTDLYDLVIKAGRRTSIVRTTSNHPFFDQTTGRWVEASALHRGDYLRTAGGAMAIVVGGHTPPDATGWMWDLTVPGNGDHDFYVDIVVTGVLVHNCDEPGMPKLHGHYATKGEALNAALGDAGITDPDLTTRDTYEDAPKMLGPKGEPWQIIEGFDGSGDVQEIQLHNAHTFSDGGGFGPHYINPESGFHYFFNN